MIQNIIIQYMCKYTKKNHKCKRLIEKIKSDEALQNMAKINGSIDNCVRE